MRLPFLLPVWLPYAARGCCKKNCQKDWTALCTALCTAPNKLKSSNDSPMCRTHLRHHLHLQRQSSNIVHLCLRGYMVFHLAGWKSCTNILGASVSGLVVLLAAGASILCTQPSRSQQCWKLLSSAANQCNSSLWRMIQLNLTMTSLLLMTKPFRLCFAMYNVPQVSTSWIL